MNYLSYYILFSEKYICSFYGFRAPVNRLEM